MPLSSVVEARQWELSAVWCCQRLVSRSPTSTNSFELVAKRGDPRRIQLLILRHQRPALDSSSKILYDSASVPASAYCKNFCIIRIFHSVERVPLFAHRGLLGHLPHRINSLHRCLRAQLPSRTCSFHHTIPLVAAKFTAPGGETSCGSLLVGLTTGHKVVRYAWKGGAALGGVPGLSLGGVVLRC